MSANQTKTLALVNEAMALYPALTKAFKHRWQQWRPVELAQADRIYAALERRCNRRMRKTLRQS